MRVHLRPGGRRCPLRRGAARRGAARRAALRNLVQQLAARGPDDLVFTAPEGGPLRISNVRHRRWDPAVRDTGLTGLTPPGLRHTAASLYIAAGTPPKVVQRIPGHASIAVTLDLYGHLYSD